MLIEFLLYSLYDVLLLAVYNPIASQTLEIVLSVLHVTDEIHIILSVIGITAS